MAILFLGNTPVDVGVSPATVSTSATGRDTAYSPSSLNCGVGQNPIINIPANGGTTFWFHMRLFTNGISNGSGTASGNGFDCFDTNANRIFDLTKGTNDYNYNLRVYGSSTISSPTYTFYSNVTYFLDFAVTVGGSGGTIRVEMYVNGVLALYAQATNSGTVKVQPRQLLCSLSARVSSGTINYSEFIAAVDEPTIGLRLATLEPTSAGFHTAWSGTVASLADTDTGSGVQTIAANDRFTSIFSAYGGAAVPAGIRGLFLKANPASIAGGPTQLDQPIRISGTDYDGSPIAVVTGTPQMREMALNPATSAPWAVASFAALEAGLKSVA